MSALDRTGTQVLVQVPAGQHDRSSVLLAVVDADATVQFGSTPPEHVENPWPLVSNTPSVHARG